MNLTIKMPNPKSYIALFEAGMDEFSDGMVKVCRESAKVALKSAQEFTPVDTGRTKQGWFLTELGRGSHRGRFLGFTVVLANRFEGGQQGRSSRGQFTKNFDIISALEYGTKPHDIPIPGGILAFKDKHTGDTVVRNLKNRGNVVKHPGTKAYGMLRKAGPIAQRVFEQMAADLAAKVVAKMSGGL